MENPARILIVDDEPSITEFVSYAMQKEGYLTEVASNGEDALEKIESDHFDLFILDIMLPGIDGYELCRRIRAKMTTPILFLSARDSELNKVVGLELGADDYLAKPFGVRELLARTRALLRRSQGLENAQPSNEVTASGITLNEDTHVAQGEKGPIDLTPREFELLSCLMHNADGNSSQKRKQSTHTSSVFAIRSRQPGTIRSSLKRCADTAIASRNKGRSQTGACAICRFEGIQ